MTAAEGRAARVTIDGFRRKLADWFELVPGGHSRMPAMEGLRGFAVILVFFVHFNHIVGRFTAPTAIRQPMMFLAEVGHIGVDLFFVMSGYLIYATVISKPLQLAKYARRRIERIYPTFLAVFAVYVGLNLALPGQGRGQLTAHEPFTYLVKNLLLLPGIFPIPALITVAWSLSYEAFFYLAMPLSVGMLRMRAWTPRWRVVWIGALSAGYLVYCMTTGGRLSRLVMFGAGVLLYERSRDKSAESEPERTGTTMIAFIAALIVYEILNGHVIREAFGFSSVYLGGLHADAVTTAVIFFPCYLLVGTALRTGLLTRVFSFTPLRYLGNMSYSYYLIHSLAMKVPELVLKRQASGSQLPGSVAWLLLPPTFLLTVVVGAALFLFVEKPLSFRRRAPAK